MNPTRNVPTTLNGWQVTWEALGFERWHVLYVIKMRFDGEVVQKAEGHGQSFASPELALQYCLERGYMRLTGRNTIIFHRSPAFVANTGKEQWYPDPKFKERLVKGALKSKSNRESKRLTRWQDAREAHLDREDQQQKMA